MDSKLKVIQEVDCEWETWEDTDASADGLVYWKTLISGDKTATNTSMSPLRFLYAFPIDSFQDVKYVFEDTKNEG